MSLPLDQWDAKVKPHLHGIAAGADMCARHAEQMFLRPNFESLAAGDLEHIEQILIAALEKIHLAQAIYRGKKIDA